MRTKINIPVVAATVLLIVPIAFIAKTTHSYNKQLYARFPEYDRKIVRKAYRKLMSDSVNGRLDTSDWTDEKFDEHFRFELFELTYTA